MNDNFFFHCIPVKRIKYYNLQFSYASQYGLGFNNLIHDFYFSSLKTENVL